MQMRPSFRGLAVTLLARAGASVALSVYLLLHRSGWSEVFRAGAWYALIDGALAMCAAILLGGPLRHRTSQMLLAMTFTDAVLRVGAGIVILLVPAIAELPMTLVPMFAGIGAVAWVLGATAVILWTVEHHRHRLRHLHGAQALFDPIPIVGVLSIAVGTMLVFDPPTSAAELREVLAMGGMVFAVSLVVSAVGALISGAASGRTAERAPDRSRDGQRDRAPDRDA